MKNLSADEVLTCALQQPETVRARIAEALIASLDADVDTGVEHVWQDELARRLAELDSGTIVCMPWEEIRAPATPCPHMTLRYTLRPMPN